MSKMAIVRAIIVSQIIVRSKLGRLLKQVRIRSVTKSKRKNSRTRD